MNKLSEKIYQLSETEHLILIDLWDSTLERLWIKIDIKNTTAADDLYRISFVNKLRRYFHFSDSIPANCWTRTNLDRPELEDEDKFSDVDIYILKNDQLIKKITYKTPHISELQNRFSEDIYKFDGKYIFNNINKSPIFICGSPGGGTSYIAKMLQYCGLFIGDDICRFEDRKTFESTSISMLQYYFVRQLIGDKSYDDIMDLYNLLDSEVAREWLISGKDGIVNSDKLDLFKKEFLKILPLFWGNNLLDLKWGFKKPFNMIWIKYFISMFPDSKVLIVNKNKSGEFKNRSIEGERFEKMGQDNYKLFTEIGDGLNCNHMKLDFYKMNTDINYFNEVMEWCGLPTKTEKEHHQLLVDIKYDELKDNSASQCPNRSPQAISEAIKEIIKDKVVCELGCAEGDNMVFMSKYAKKVVGLEYSDRINPAIERGLDVKRGDYYELDFDDFPKADVYYFWPNNGDEDNKYLCDKIYSNENFKGYIIVAGDTGWPPEPPSVRECAKLWDGTIKEVEYNEGTGHRQSGTFVLAIIEKKYGIDYV
jgi:hypothetical protein